MSNQDLSRRIRRSKCLTADGKDFVPNNAIQDFTSQGEVQRHLEAMAEKRVFPKNTAIQPLIDYVMDQNRPAKKIYLILELCKSLKYLSILRDAKFFDKHLPIEAKWSEDEDRYIVTTKGPKGRVTHAAFRNWDENDIDSFKDKQWLFMAPVFVSGRFDYAVNVNCPLPILPNDEETDHVNVGYSGAVYEVKVHEAHLEVCISHVLRLWFYLIFSCHSSAFLLSEWPRRNCILKRGTTSRKKPAPFASCMS